VTVSDFEACAKVGCSSLEEKKPAYFQGASADGSKVFFMTEQKLLSKEASPTRNLYEYDFAKPAGERLVLLSQPKAGPANVQSALRASPDGSHVYFAAAGVLTEEANEYGEKAKPAPNSNLYGFDTITNGIRFIATASAGSASVWGLFPTESTRGEERIIGPFEAERSVQITPDGRDLVFSSPAALAHHKPEAGVSSVYRYDFVTGELTWISHAAPEFATPPGGERSSFIQAQPGRQFKIVGPNADFEDWSRAMSGLKVGEANREYVDAHDGEYIVFTTATQ
jgi:hypothetical protein